MELNTFDDLRAIFRDDARDAFLDLVERRPGELVCAFALVTDDDASGASGAGDTLERREKRLAARQPRTATEQKFLQWEFAWQADEWDSIYSADQPNTRQRHSAREYFRGMMAFRNQWTSRPGHSDRQFRRHALRAMVDALAELDAAGLFGTGRERDMLTVFVEMTDSDDADALKLLTARKLNPPLAAQRLTSSLPVQGKLLVLALSAVRWPMRGRLC